MNNYTNFSNQPHLLTITNKKTNQVFLKKKFPNEKDALNYLNEARDFKNNKKHFTFTISGPNMLYYCS